MAFVLPLLVGYLGYRGVKDIMEHNENHDYYGKETDDLYGKREARDQILLRFNATDKQIVAPFRNGLIVLGTEDPNNQTAVFSYADGQAEGILSGFPTREENGVMQGGFAIPGLDKPVEGDWISVDKSVADAKTACAFDKATELVATGDQVSAEPLVDMLEWVKAKHCERAVLEAARQREDRMPAA